MKVIKSKFENIELFKTFSKKCNDCLQKDKHIFLFYLAQIYTYVMLGYPLCNFENLISAWHLIQTNAIYNLFYIKEKLVCQHCFCKLNIIINGNRIYVDIMTRENFFVKLGCAHKHHL